mmetsp:Transcript_6157/g.10695  ORF Transcript_6157/g.10695 Transcript_6157/m.10695 type:complete len:399 (-) Transcript_6157:85-1281(-)
MPRGKVNHEELPGAVATEATMRSVIFSGTLLIGIIIIRSMQAVLMEECAVGHKYPFVFQTLMLFPFFMQTVLFFLLTALEYGLRRGISTLVSSAKHMGPVVFFSSLLTVNVVAQGWALVYIDSSTYVVVLQLLVIFVAIAERVLLKREMSAMLWSLVFVQSGAIMSYQWTVSNSRELAHYSSGGEPDGSQLTAPVHSAGTQIIGVLLVVGGMMCCAIGGIFQQRFLQETAELRLSLNVKLFYQFLFGFLGIVLYTISSREAMDSIMKEGFFHGWSHTTLEVGMLMWAAYLVSTLICAYLSALAGAMAIALVVIAVGAFNAIVRDWTTSPLQVVLMVVVSGNSAFFAYLRAHAAPPPPHDVAVKDETDGPTLTLHGLQKGFGTFSADAKRASKFNVEEA